MALPQGLQDLIIRDEQIVCSLQDPAVTELAKQIAFYTALIDAAPSDHEESQEEINETLAWMKERKTKLTETYMELTEEYL